MSKYKSGIDEINILRLTKACPQCKTRIEKNGGCVHMTCSNCHYEFCWNCGHEWKSHQGDPYSCENYTYSGNAFPKKTTEEEKTTTQPFIYNLKSYEEEKFMKQALINKIKTAFEKDGIDEVLAQKSANQIYDVLLEGRSILIWTYPKLNYINDPQKLNIMKMWKNDLNIALSRLCEYIEVSKVIRYNELMKRTHTTEAAYTSILKNCDALT